MVSNVFCVIVASELNVEVNILHKAFALLIMALLGIFNNNILFIREDIKLLLRSSINLNIEGRVSLVRYQ